MEYACAAPQDCCGSRTQYLFCHVRGALEVTPDKKIVWEYKSGTARPALDDEHAPSGNGCSVDCRVVPDLYSQTIFCPAHFERRELAEKVIAVREPPAILRRSAGIFPFNLSVSGNHGHLARSGIRRK